ncbi:MAG: hypothetical protein ACFFDN_17320 [Candidatus Hodarchaeota archaeon]
MATRTQLNSKNTLEIVVISRDSEPMIKDVMEHRRYLRILGRCDGCSRNMTYWSVDNIAYFPEAVLRICSNKDVREAVLRMQEMIKDKPLYYYAISGKWLIFKELNAFLED